MAQWIQSQSNFLGVTLFFWVLFTCIAIGLRSCPISDKGRQAWNRVIETYQIFIFILMCGNFIGYGPVRETISYLRTHWIFCSVLIFVSYYIGMFLLVNDIIIGSLTLVIISLIIAQATFQSSIVTPALAVIYIIDYTETISELTKYNSIVISFDKIKSKLSVFRKNK